MTTDARRRVLVVDDNRDSTETLSLLLTAKGHDARTSTSGSDAITIADEFLPQAVILDLSLPDMDGYEVARRLRAKSYGGGLVLVALTGWSGAAVREKAAQAGFDFHLLKPVEWSALEEALSAKPVA